jgi:hypothetical protein
MPHGYISETLLVRRNVPGDGVLISNHPIFRHCGDERNDHDFTVAERNGTVNHGHNMQKTQFTLVSCEEQSDNQNIKCCYVVINAGGPETTTPALSCEKAGAVMLISLANTVQLFYE